MVKKLVILDLNNTLFHKKTYRPFLDEFLDELFNHYCVAIWSNLSRRKIINETDKLGITNDLEFIFDYKRRRNGKKCLKKVWNNYPQWDETNTIIIDDSSRKIRNSQRDNHIHIEKYYDKNSDDDELLDLIEEIHIRFDEIEE